MVKTRQGKVFTGNKETILICFGFDVVSDTVEIQAPQFDRLRVVAVARRGKYRAGFLRRTSSAFKQNMTKLIYC